MENVSVGAGFNKFCKKCGKELKRKGDYMVCSDSDCGFKFKLRIFGKPGIEKRS